MEEIRREEPQRYGVLDKNFEEARTALERCDRSYPSSSQVYEYLDDDTQEEVPATEFGYTLTTLNQLGAVELWNEGVHDTKRYDLTSLDEDYLDSIEALLEEQDQS